MNKIDITSLRVAIVADWLTNFGGAESVIESMVNIFPNSQLCTTLFVPEKMKKLGRHKNVQTSYLQKFPKFLRKNQRFFLAFLPKAIESLNLNDFDLVISSSSFVGKGVITNPDTLHICYCHTPARFLWGQRKEFLKNYPLPSFLKIFLPPIFSKLRIWDKFSAQRPDFYLANSDFTKENIWQFWRRESEVLPPPVDIERFLLPVKNKKEDYFLFIGRLVPQKNIDFLINVFKKLPDKKLKIAGIGPMENKLKEMATEAKNIEFLGYIEDKHLNDLYAKAQAVIFPHTEDAGIVPLESLASGTAVIALRKGGVLTTLNEEVAVFFENQTEEELKTAIENFNPKNFDLQKLRKHAEKFSRDKFEQKLLKIIEEKWQEFSKNH